MSSSLETRVLRLEQQQVGEAGASAIRLMVSFLSPGLDGAKPVDQARDGQGKTWQRADGESEQDFLSRAWAGVDACPRGCARVLLVGAA